MAKTLEAIIDDVLRELSQIPGSGTQLFSEDIVAQKIQKMFDFAWPEIWWGEYMEWFTGTLDGTTGVVTEDISRIKSYHDIRAVYPSNSDHKLAALPFRINPTRLTGTSAAYIEQIQASHANSAKLLRVYPLTATDSIDIHARVKPDDFALDDTIYMDHNLLVTGAAWDYIEGDGTNPSEAAKLQNQFETRLGQLKKLDANKPIVLSSPRGRVPAQWYSNP